MKINTLETHDRLIEAQKEQVMIQKGFEDCKFKNPLSQQLFQYSNYIYIFAHKREIGLDEKKDIFLNDYYKSVVDPTYVRKYESMSYVPSFRILWQPRLSKPEAQENSYLFRSLKDNNDTEVYWIIPPKELWGQNKRGNMLEDPIISESIHKFKNSKEQLEAPHKDDLSDEKIRDIYTLLENLKKPAFKMI